MNESVRYTLRDDAAYVVEDYQAAKPFSSFLPGIAGVWGTPLWAYYVNRGQGIACFGTQDKNHAIMEFQSANLHHRRVATEGFRTLLRITDASGLRCYEPFRVENPGMAVRQTLTVLPASLRIREENDTLGLTVEVEYFVLPNEPFAALARTVTLTNTSGAPLHIQMADGFPKMVPFGMPAVLLQKMPFVSDSYLRIENLAGDVPYISMESAPGDEAETKLLQAGNFFFGFRDGQLLDAVVDPEVLFGDYLDLTKPYNFFRESFTAPTWQAEHCGTPCAFTLSEFTLQPGESQQVNFLAGHASRLAEAQAIPARVMAPGYLANAAAISALEVEKVKALAYTHSGSREIDLYTPATFLDNTLRGGLPVSLQAGEKTHTLHVYSRKHGDLERDYNFFQLAPTFFSQGNGNFRDVNQNRRNDVWFNPDIADENVYTFFNLLQPDGFNPLVIQGATFAVTEPNKLSDILAKALPKSWHRLLTALLTRSFTPGTLFAWLAEHEINLLLPREDLLASILAISEKRHDSTFGEGYWTDHWFYNFDLLDGYLAIFPEKLRHILLERGDFTYYDTEVGIRPRSERFVRCSDGHVRQLNCLRTDGAKAKLIASRAEMPHTVRTGLGDGEVYYSNLLGKIVCLLANKAAALSASGVGVEMEGGRPGWYDSINGIPALFGASTSEIFQLLRVTRQLTAWFAELGLPANYVQRLPVEIFDLFRAVQAALTDYLASDDPERDYNYWDAASTAKEHCRARTARGFTGVEREITVAEIRSFCQTLEERIQASLPDAVDAETGLHATYITHTPLEWEDVLVDGRPLVDDHGRTCVKVLRFARHNFPLFLEAAVHSLRLEEDPETARELWTAVRGSALYDSKLGMYLTNASIHDESPELGRIHAWPAGWFENENVFMHLEYKYLLQMLRAGLYEEFFADVRQVLIPFQNMATFGRHPLENCSFIVSSHHPRPVYHGRGFQPRSSGTTAEWLNMMLIISFGAQPFRYESGELLLRFTPSLPAWFFTAIEETGTRTTPEGEVVEHTFPAHSYSTLLLGHTLVTYHNPRGRSCYGPNAVSVTSYSLSYDDGYEVTVPGAELTADYALAVRERRVREMVVELG